MFSDVVQDYLRRIEYDADGYASLIHVPAYSHAQFVVDQTRSFGAPIFERGGARVDDLLLGKGFGDRSAHRLHRHLLGPQGRLEPAGARQS